MTIIAARSARGFGIVGSRVGGGSGVSPVWVVREGSADETYIGMSNVDGLLYLAEKITNEFPLPLETLAGINELVSGYLGLSFANMEMVVVNSKILCHVSGGLVVEYGRNEFVAIGENSKFALGYCLGAQLPVEALHLALEETNKRATGNSSEYRLILSDTAAE